MESRPRKLKRVIIREEFIALTGNHVRAVLLHQLEFRQKCAFDVDAYLMEEGERLSQAGIAANVLPANGWFYKKATELAKETMLGLDETTIRRHLKFFILRGWVDERRNPKKRWDRTMQYRLNLVRVKCDLEAIGYQLEEWVFDEPLNALDSTTGILHVGSGKTQDRSGILQLPSGKMQEQYQNTSSKQIENNTHNTAAGCVSKSQFSSEEISRYVEDCARQGQQIRGGLAVWLQETGKGDNLIAASLERKKLANFQTGKLKPRHTSECPGCFGTQMEVVQGKGARPCTYSEQNNFCEVNITVQQQNDAP